METSKWVGGGTVNCFARLPRMPGYSEHFVLFVRGFSRFFPRQESGVSTPGYVSMSVCDHSLVVADGS